MDFAVLYGNKNDKTFISFQMKCYSNQTYLNELIVNKAYIKSQISHILINSIKLLNCKITKWHYYLIFYYNKRDLTTNNIGIKNLILSLNKGIEVLLYNPLEKNFFSLKNEGISLVTNLMLNDKSNLDYCYYLNDKKNYCYFEPEFKKINKREELISDYWDGLSNFIKDFKIYSKNDILGYLCTVFKVSNLFYCSNFHDTIINKPNNQKIFLYKKKNSNHFIGIKNNNNNITYYDLENKKEVTNGNYIDLNYKYVYILDYNSLKRNDFSTFEDIEIGQLYEKKKEINDVKK